MGFLDNSGDIILDAVLTDLGRKKLSEGGNAFVIKYFALGDDEINYKLYNPTHASGSAYYDLEIIQTPILESFTNNASSMKSTLMSFDNDNIIYLPVLKLNSTTNSRSAVHNTENVHLIAVDKNTQGNPQANNGSADRTAIGGNGEAVGVIFGLDPNQGGSFIRVDQGIDNEEYTYDDLTPENLLETSYIIQIDGKFGTIVDIDGKSPGTVTTDDDGIKYYTISHDSRTSDTQVITMIEDTNSPIAGSKGTKLEFKIKADQNLSSNFSRFERYGFTKSILGNTGVSKTTSCIDTVVRITGVNYGMSIDIPVRFVKQQ